MGFLTGKKALITGVASNRSIAYGIAEAMHKQGAELAFTYQNEKLASRVKKFSAQWSASSEPERCFPCEVTDANASEAVFTELKTHWDHLDILVHCIGFAPGEELDGSYIDAATREGFHTAHDISSYSLTALSKAAKPMLSNQAAVLTLTYLGSQRAIPNYNVMGLAKASLEANMRYLAASLGADGIRVNALSAGPIRTLAASGIKQFRKMLSVSASMTPLQKNVTIEEVGNTAAFLCSDLASGITGQTLYVDAGFNIAAMNPALLDAE